MENTNQDISISLIVGVIGTVLLVLTVIEIIFQSENTGIQNDIPKKR